MEQWIKHSWIPGKWCCAGRGVTRPEETVWGRRAAPAAAWPGRGRGRWRVKFLGAAMCHAAALAPQLCLCPALRDSQHSLMGFVLLIGGSIMAIRHLHVPPVTLQHMVLLNRSNSGSKKSISFPVYRKTACDIPALREGKQHLHEFHSALSHIRL